MAASVGNKFVQVYFTALNSNPLGIASYFSEESAFTFGYEDEQLHSQDDSVTGLENIRKKVQSIGFKNCQASLTLVDCQATINDGVLVFVIGNLINDGKNQKFAQSFILARQTDTGYFCLNAVFRYLKETPAASTAAVSPQPVQHKQPEIEQPKPQEKPIEAPKAAPKIEQPEPVQLSEPKVEKKVEEKKPEQPVHQEKTNNVVAPAQTQQPAHKANDQRPPKNDKKKNQNKRERDSTKSTTSTSTNQAAQQPSQPSSWANIAKNSPSQTIPTPSPTNNKPAVTNQTAPATQTVNQPTTPQPVQKPQQPQQQAQQPRKAEQKAEKSSMKDDKSSMKEGCSAYVSNIPFSATEESLRTALGPLGEISSVVLRSQKGFCFLEYNDPETVQRVIEQSKAHPVFMEGRLITIEEKKPKSEKFIVKEKKEKKFSKPRNVANNNGYMNGKDNLQTSKPKKSYFKENIIASSS